MDVLWDWGYDKKNASLTSLLRTELVRKRRKPLPLLLAFRHKEKFFLKSSLPPKQPSEAAGTQLYSEQY